MKNDNKIARRALLTGGLALAASKRVLAGAAADAQAPPPLTPLPEPQPNPNHLTDGAVADLLGSLFRSTCMGGYAGYFYLQTIRWTSSYGMSGSGFNDAAAYGLSYVPTPANKYCDYVRPQYDPKNCILTMNYRPDIAACRAFASDQPHKNLSAVFVEQHYKGADFIVPFDIASVLSSCFVAGLVSRLILGDYAEAWKNALQTSTPVSFEESTVPKASEGVDKLITTIVQNIGYNSQSVSFWQRDYAESIRDNIDPSLQGAGVLMGWRAGDALANCTDAADKTNARKIIWELIGWRFTTKSIGKLMGYTLMLLSGFLENDRTQAVIAYSDSTAALARARAKGGLVPEATPPDPAKFGDLGKMLDDMSTQIRINRSSKSVTGYVNALTNGFYRLLKGELVGITQKSLTPGEKQEALKQYSAFIGGFVQGIVQTADKLFDEFYNEGYTSGYEEGLQIGYANGFRDGYSQGFSAGYTTGYGAGYGDGSSATGGLNSIIGGISKTLSSGDELLKDAGTVGTVITGIVALF